MMTNAMFVTRLTSHALTSEVKLAAKTNISFILVTFPTSHRLKSALN